MISRLPDMTAIFQPLAQVVLACLPPQGLFNAALELVQHRPGVEILREDVTVPLSRPDGFLTILSQSFEIKLREWIKLGPSYYLSIQVKFIFITDIEKNIIKPANLRFRLVLK